MSVPEIIGGVIMLVASLSIMLAVVLQDSPRDGGLTSLGVGSDSYFSKNKGRTVDAMLSRLTKIAGVVFFVVTVVVYAISTM